MLRKLYALLFAAAAGAERLVTDEAEGLQADAAALAADVAAVRARLQAARQEWRERWGLDDSDASRPTPPAAVPAANGRKRLAAKGG